MKEEFAKMELPTQITNEHAVEVSTFIIETIETIEKELNKYKEKLDWDRCIRSMMIMTRDINKKEQYRFVLYNW